MAAEQDKMGKQSFLQSMWRQFSGAMRWSGTTPHEETINSLLTAATFGRRMKPLLAEQAVNLTNVTHYRNEYFPSTGPYPWLDFPDAEQQVLAKLHDGLINTDEAEQCHAWIKKGYIIIPNLIEHEILDRVWAAYEAAVANGDIVLPTEKISADDPYPGRFLDPHLRVPELCHILRHPGLLRWLRVLMGHEPVPFQTITSHKGSQQGVHSDAIHMTTYPLGYLSAAWIAFEDIHPDCGPLVYYPGSHRLPYVFSKDLGIPERDFVEHGYQSYHERYEPFIQQLIADNGLEPHYFHAGKGDVLVWHMNLLHGGSLRRNVALSRHAVVCHFFVEGAFAYHDLAGTQTRPYASTCLLRDQERVAALAQGRRRKNPLLSLLSMLSRSA